MADEPYDPKKHGEVITTPTAAASAEVPYDPKAHGEVLSPAAQLVDKVAGDVPAAVTANAGDFARWLRTRAINAAEGVLTTRQSINDLNAAIAQKTAEFFGAGPTTQKVVGTVASYMNPLTWGANAEPTREQIHAATNKNLDIKDVNAPKSVLGIPGQVIDKGTEAVLGSLATPAGGLRSVVRNVVPAFVGGAASEGAGEALKDTPFEIPGRYVAGLLGGLGTGAAQNVVTSTAKGVANIVGSNARNAEQQAARILGREALADYPPTPPGLPPRPTLADIHSQYLPGTPLAATFPQGGNLAGAVRGALTLKGPARGIVTKGADDFIEGADARVAPVLDRISPLPPAEVRTQQLMDQARTVAPPIYRQAGVADLPQQILQQKPGAPSVVPSAILGPDGQPMMTTRPGPPVTSVTTNSPVLQSPALAQYMTDSGHIQDAIRRVQKLPAFKNEPVTSMAMLDQVYKDLGSLESTAKGAKDFGQAGQIGQVRRTLGEHIEAENPVYGRALQAFADPASLADAATLGKTLAKQNIPPEDVARQFRDLQSDAHRREFLGGFAGELRGKAGGTDRATPAERFWNSDYTRGKVQALFPTATEAGPSNTFDVINTALQNERQAARTLRDITKGSTTANKAAEISDLGGGEAGSTLMSLLHKGVAGTAIAKGLEHIGAISNRATEGRTQAVNEALARMSMQTNPADIVRTQGLVAAARQQAAATAAGRQGSFTGGAVGGLLNASAAGQQLGPADRLMQGLLMGGP
jgi:hypothetical protein